MARYFARNLYELPRSFDGPQVQNAAEQFTHAVFWISLAGLVWPFLGYPLLMLVRATVQRGEEAAGADLNAPAVLPRATVLLAVRNAAQHIEARLENVLAQAYPCDRLDVFVVCNGSADRTEALARGVAARQAGRVRVLTSPAADGKAGALNAAAAAAEGEILIFADARQRFERDAVRQLVGAFADAEVGAVSGRLVIRTGDTEDVAGIARYWELETRLRWAESRTGSVVGATGAIYAIRRSLYRPLPSGVILDDVYLPMQVVLQGYRVVLEPSAIAYDRPSLGIRAEYRRRVRTMVGNLELVRLIPELLVPWRNPIFGRYVSHKLLRVAAPAFSLGLLVSSLALPGIGQAGVAGALLAAYALGAVGLVLPMRLLALPTAFLLLHAAGLSALLRPRRTASELWG